MTYQGHIRNGIIVLDEPASLAEGARVRIEVLDAEEANRLHPDIARFTGILPSDIDVDAQYVEGMIRKHT